jgi:hypothetical protein
MGCSLGLSSDMVRKHRPPEKDKIGQVTLADA